LISVLTGRASADLLHTYTAERWAAAKGLVDFDHRWSRVIGERSDEGGDDTVPRFQREFIANGEFTAGLTIQYEPSALIGPQTWQSLAKGFPIGKRLHSAPVIRLGDAKPMELGHAIEADGRWRLFAFAPAGDGGEAGGAVHTLCEYLASAASPIQRHTRAGEDIDAVIDLRAVFQQVFRDLDIAAMPSLLRPHKGRFGLCDYEKVFCADLTGGQDIFDMREIDRAQGCIVVVRPDQYVAHVLPMSEVDGLAAFFAGILLAA
jgi:phenol 2-monooxygenase